MAIRIPSKNIYSIQNERVLDNAIDGVSIEYNSVARNNEYDKLVYLDEKEISSPPYSSYTPQDKLNTALLLKGGYVYVYGFTYIKIDRSYSTITSRIPIVGNKYYVSRLTAHNDGDEKKGNYLVIGKTSKGSVNAVASTNGATVGEPTFNITNIIYGEPTSYEQGKMAIPTNGTSFQDVIKIEYDGRESSVTNELTFDDNVSNFSKIETKKVTIDNIDYLETTLTYLTRVRVTKLRGINENLNVQVSSTTFLQGEYEEYTPTNVEISFYGDTIGISTEDKTITIGNENAETPLNVSGNELMQNASDLSSKYNNTLEQYSFGKEIVHITCDIDDYYDYANPKKLKICANNPNVINTNNYVELWNATYNNGRVSQLSADTSNIYRFQIQAYKNGEFIEDLNYTTITNSQLVSLNFKKDDGFNQLRFKLNGSQQDTGILFDVSNLEKFKTYSFIANVNIDGGQGNISWNEMRIIKGVRYKQFVEQGLHMTFDIYDEVIPFVCVQDEYTNKLVDVPLSTNSDGTPKTFKVLANKFSSNGKVFQELFLQEA